MNILVKEHQQLISILIDAGVEFILVGGYAVNFHGYIRSTGDMDLWLKPDNINKDKLVSALLEQGFEQDDLSELIIADFTKHLVFSMWEEPYKVDFLTYISGVNFDDAWNHKDFLPMGERQIPVINLNHLVLSKISNSRPQDKADVSELQKIASKKKK